MENQKFKTKKSLGQHFLTSEIVPKWMCDAACITAGDIVLEIGPGTGVLTKELLLRGAKVIALEADQRAIEVLKETFPQQIHDGSLHIHYCDVREFNLAAIDDIKDHEFKVVANIPYYLSGMLFRVFLESPIQPTLLVYLVQKEVAKRITAEISKGGKESLLSLSVKAYGTPSYVKTVSRGHFSPVPNVDSAIILITDINRKNFKALEPDLFFKLLHIGFGQKRKQLLGNLSKFYERNTLTNIFSTLGVPVSTRAEDLSLKKWLTLVYEISVRQ